MYKTLKNPRFAETDILAGICKIKLFYLTESVIIYVPLFRSKKESALMPGLLTFTFFAEA